MLALNLHKIWNEQKIGPTCPSHDNTYAFLILSNGVSSIKKQWTNSENQCEKVIHKKSVGKAGYSKNSNSLPSPLIFYAYLFTLTVRLRWKRHWYAGSDRKKIICTITICCIAIISATGSHFSCLHFYTSIRPNSALHLGPFPNCSFQT